MGKARNRKKAPLAVDYGHSQQSERPIPAFIVQEDPAPSREDTGLERHVAVLNCFSLGDIPSVAGTLGLTAEELGIRIGMSRSTFHRKSKRPRALLSVPESDALSRYIALLERALRTFDGDAAASRRWLNAPQPGLGTAIPLEVARTTWGYLQVEQLLVRIDFGVYA